MSLHSFEFDFARLSDAADARDADVWFQVRMIADAIPRDVDLSDDLDVTRSLYRAGFANADFGHVLDLAIERAKANRELGL